MTSVQSLHFTALAPQSDVFTRTAQRIGRSIAGIFQGKGSSPPPTLGPALSGAQAQALGQKYADQLGERFGPEFGKRFDAKAPEGTVFNGYRVLGDKAKGVEPGFIAHKDWSAQDDHKLQQPHEPLHQAARQWVHQQIAAGSPLTKEPVQMAIQTLAAQGHADPDTASALKAMAALPEKAGSLALQQCDADLMAEIVQQTVKHIAAAHDSPAAAPLYQDLKQHLMASQPQFTEKHYIKLDYYETDKSIFGNYTIPYDKTKAMAGIPVLGNLGHQWAKSVSPREINSGAVNEKLANDLMGVLGMKTQTLELVHATYADGTPKLLLDGTHIEGFNDFDGEKTAHQGSVYIKDGVLVRNSRLPTDPPGSFNGPAQLHTEIQELGGKKIMMLLLADRDALGSTGGNKGFVGDQFFAIDPGHALEESLLSKRGDVHSDLSFDPASSLASKDYKNFSIFDQSTFAEKMQGVRALQQLDGRDSAVFEEFARKYGPDNGHEALDFKDQLLKTQALYLGRKNDILTTFSSRLAVDNYQFGAGIDDSPELHAHHRDQTLNLLDGLEKLSSATVGTAQGRKDGVRLDIPQLKSPGDRKPWDVRQNGEQIEFTFAGQASDAKKILATLDSYAAAPGHPAPPPYVIDRSVAGRITLRVPGAQIVQAQAAFDYRHIMQFKHG